LSSKSQKDELQKFYGDNYPVISDLLGEDSRSDEYLFAIQKHLQEFGFKPRTSASNRDLIKFASYLYKAEKLLEKYPDIPYQLIYTEGAKLPDFITPKSPASANELHAILKHFAVASRRAVDAHQMPPRRRPPQVRKFILLRYLIFEYIRIFEAHPPYSRESKFHELMGYLLIHAGYKFSSEQPIIEDMLQSALLSVVERPPPI